MSQYPSPKLDLEVQLGFDALPTSVTRSMSLDRVAEVRRQLSEAPGIDWSRRAVEVTEHRIASFDGTEILVCVARRTDHRPGGAAIYFVHGGALVAGDAWSGADPVLDWVERHDAVLASVEYRLAPEHPHPIPVEDAYAGLVWFAGEASELGFDSNRIMLTGASGGGPPAAGSALLARDRNAPPVHALMLFYPMLDDRVDTVSARQFETGTVWDAISNVAGWTALLGDRRGTADVPIYAAPGRATDLSNLPPTFIDAGSCEVLRDESVAFASTIWACGGSAELHIWPGAFHASELFAPDADVSTRTVRARDAWAARYLSP
jgi:acetyl esterase/lipase